jgi:hypothetical protein
MCLLFRHSACWHYPTLVVWVAQWHVGWGAATFCGSGWSKQGSGASATMLDRWPVPRTDLQNASWYYHCQEVAAQLEGMLACAVAAR